MTQVPQLPQSSDRAESGGVVETQPMHKVRVIKKRPAGPQKITRQAVVLAQQMKEAQIASIYSQSASLVPPSLQHQVSTPQLMTQTLEAPGRLSRNTQYPLQVATSFSNQGSRNTHMSILPKIS